MLDRGGPSGRARDDTPTSTTRVDGADAVLIQIRVGGQAARMVDESVPLACGCLGQETTGFGGLAKALRTVPVVLEIAERVRGAGARRLDRRLHEPGRHRHEGAARRRATARSASAARRWSSSSTSRGCSTSRPSASSSTTSGSTTSPGRSASASTEPTCCRSSLGEHADRVAPATGLPRRARAAPRHRAVLLPALLLRARRRGRAPARARVARRGGRGDRARAARALRRRDARREARAARAGAAAPATPRRRSSCSRACSAARARPATCQPPQRRHAAVPRRRRGRRGARRVAPRRASSRCELPQLGPLERGLVAHVSAYEELALDAALHGGRERVFRALLAHPLIGQQTSPSGWPTR